MTAVGDFGLYIHIPFCSKLCHYCDFAKTANFGADHVQKYMATVERQFVGWMEKLGEHQVFSSVFFGGGTPGLLGHEYSSLMARIKPFLAHDAELTIEANPANVSLDRLKLWRDLGFTRLSVGVQSFSDEGLRVLTRDHTGADAERALELATTIFSRVNGDLIYGWPGQTDAIWHDDLVRMIACGVGHLSLYALTFEGHTPFARAERRGVLRAEDDDVLARRYSDARRILGGVGFAHDEISNWAKPGHACRHNWLYWTGAPYLGLGAGAHGFVADSSQLGMRYSYTGDLRKFLREADDGGPFEIIENDRTIDTWIMEYIGSGLRCASGIDEAKIEARGFRFAPTATVRRGLDEGLLIRNDGHITLDPAEWFRETAWGLALVESFVQNMILNLEK